MSRNFPMLGSFLAPVLVLARATPRTLPPIVAIRTLPSFALELEVSGRWPWPKSGR
jgi:hypothetical protein